MRNKKIFWLAALGIVALAFGMNRKLLLTGASLKEEIGQVTVPTYQTEMTEPTLDDLKRPEDSQSENKDAQFAQQAWFHEDLYLDYILARGYMYPCTNQTYKAHLSSQSASKKIQQAAEQFKKVCQQWSQRYPEFTDETFSLDAVEASSELGKRLKHSPKRDPSNPKSRLEFIQESLDLLDWGVENGSLAAIEQGVKWLRVRWRSPMTRPEQEIIGGELHYSNGLSVIAVQLLKCQKDADFSCQSGDLTMLVKCLEDESVCIGNEIELVAEIKSNDNDVNYQWIYNNDTVFTNINGFK